MGIFDWFKNRSADRAAQKVVAETAATLFPGGQEQVLRGGEQISRLLKGRLTKEQAAKLFGSVMYLAVYGKDRSPERIRASIVRRGSGAISQVEAAEIYKLIISQAPSVLKEARHQPPVYIDVDSTGRITLLGPKRSFVIEGTVFSVFLQIAQQAGWKEGGRFLEALQKSKHDPISSAATSGSESYALGTTLQLEMNKHGVPISKDAAIVRDFIAFCFEGGFKIVFPPKSSVPTVNSINRQPELPGTAHFQDVIRGIIQDVTRIDLRAAGGFKGVSLDPLEVQFFLAWAIEVAFRGLRNYDKHLRASAFVVREMLADVQKRAVNTAVVEELFHKRFVDYSNLFKLQDGEDAGQVLLRTCKRVAENVTGEREPHIITIMAITTYWWPTVTEYPKILVDLDRDGKIIW